LGHAALEVDGVDDVAKLGLRVGRAHHVEDVESFIGAVLGDEPA
jgi:hypothetical protein